MATTKLPDGLTFRISTNKRDKTTTIVAYRKGRSKYPYKAVLPMCDKKYCHQNSPHTERYLTGGTLKTSLRYLSYHQSDVDTLVRKLIKSYS